jgi:hypothetical protein
MQQVLIDAAHAADRNLHYTKRPDRAKFNASTLTQTLVLGWLAHPDASLEQLAQSAARLGLDVTAQAIDQRFSVATADLLREVLAASAKHLIAADPVAIPIRKRFTGVRIQDSTTIVLPDQLAHHWAGCGGSSDHNTAAALTCGVQCDLLTGALTARDLADGRASDHRLPLQHAQTPKGSLRLAALGCYDLQVLGALTVNAVYWLSKIEPNAIISDASRKEQALLEYIKHLGAFQQWQGQVWVGRGQRRACRLLVVRAPQEVLAQRRRRIRATAKQKGVTPSASALAVAEWTILRTNIPEELLRVEEALVVAKVRWQIALLFKLWKSHGTVDEWRSQKAERILCDVDAKLIAMVIPHWMLVVSCWEYAERSLVKAAQVVRDQAPERANARGQRERLNQVLSTIQRVLKRCARMNTRRTQPKTYQLLLALTTEPLQA